MSTSLPKRGTASPLAAPPTNTSPPHQPLRSHAMYTSGQWVHTGILLDFLWVSGCLKLLAGFSAPHPILGLHSGVQRGAARPALRQLLLRPSYNWTPSPQATETNPTARLPPRLGPFLHWAQPALLRNELEARWHLRLHQAPQRSAELWAPTYSLVLRWKEKWGAA